MATTEKNNINSFNCDCEAKLLLDELMSTPSSNEHMYTSSITMFTYIHEKAHYDNICKITPSTICEKNKKGFKQKVMVKTQVRGEESRVC